MLKHILSLHLRLFLSFFLSFFFTYINRCFVSVVVVILPSFWVWPFILYISTLFFLFREQPTTIDSLRTSSCSSSILSCFFSLLSHPAISAPDLLYHNFFPLSISLSLFLLSTLLYEMLKKWLNH